QRSSGFSRTSAGTQSRSIRRIRAVRRPRASCRSDRSALLAPAPETGGSWLAAGCASISRWNAKIRPTNHARSRRLGADVGARRTAPPGSTAPRQLTYGPLYALSAAIRAQAERQMPGVRVSTGQPAGLGRRGGGNPVQAVIGGPDYERLAEWSDRLYELAQSNPGLMNVETSFKARKPQIRVSVDRDRAADLGISLQTVGRTLETMLGSRVVTTYVERGREYDVILQGRDDFRETSTDLTNIHVRSSRGELIPLASVIRLEETSGTMALSRFNRLRSKIGRAHV